jgi:hypothetical protein
VSYSHRLAPMADSHARSGIATAVSPAQTVDSATAPPAASRVRQGLDWLRLRPTLVAAIVYAVLALAFVGQGLVPGRTLSSSDSLYGFAPWNQDQPAGVQGLGSNYELADAAVVFQPFLQHNRDVLPHIPLWNSHISMGRPYLANAQNAIFSPFSAPAYVLPFWRSLALIAALKLFVAAFGTFLLARALGMRFGGALLSGLVFAFGTFFVVWLAWPLTNIFPLIPWLLLLSELLVRRPGPLPAAGLAALVAMTYFGGHPETTFHALFATVVFFVFRLLLWARDRRAAARELVRPALTFAVAFGVGTALAAVMLLPLYELMMHSGDLARRREEDAGFWPRRYLGTLFLHDYWGRPTQTNLEPFMQIRGWYAGALTLMLASAALIVRPTRTRIAIALFAVFSATMVLGLGPLWSLLTDYVPGFDSAHNERMLIYVLFGLALLAGWGLDDLSERIRSRRRLLVIGTSVAIFCVPFAWMLVSGSLTSNMTKKALEVAWGFSDPARVDAAIAKNSAVGDVVRMSALFQWIPLAGIGVALIALRLRPSRPLAVVPFVAIAVLLLAADLFRANMGFNSAIPTRLADVPATGAIRYLQSQRPNRFVGLNQRFGLQPVPPDTAMKFGLYDARGYDYPAEKRYDRLWRRNVAPGVPDFTQPIVLATGTPAAIRALNLLSVSDFIQDAGDKPLRGSRLRVAYRGRDAVVYRNPDALPRVFLVGGQRTVGSAEAALAAATAPGFQGRRVAVTEREVPGLPQAGGAPAPSGSARLVSYENQRVVADSDATRRSMLVLTDLKFPGWKATVDGKPATIERVDYLLRGVVVPPGRHRVEFSYEPASFRAGWIISLLALIALVAAVVVGVRARRRHRDA